ncbi:MAG TPA: HEPN domain-containing protein [Anaerolineaceae bacterium]|jgi:HEPN domain-containing protein
MNPLTLEWVEKAEGDFATAGRELIARRSPNYDAVCFHAQQVAEKYLKAFLQENGFAIPKTQILLDLLALCLKIEPSFQVIREQLNTLEGYSVQFRYPGQSANKIEAKLAYQTAIEVRHTIRNRLGLG